MGAKPAQLFETRDDGETFEQNRAFAGFPGREDWTAGAAGLTLRTIVTHPEDPGKLWLGGSAAGVFASEDGGASWDRRNRRSNAGTAGAHAHADGSVHREGDQVGQCVHNLVRAPGTADRLDRQNHEGVWRSLDGGRSWDEISGGLPSTFGFPIAVHPRNARTIWTLPLNGDMAGRYPPEASAAVWKSVDDGENWSEVARLLPTVLGVEVARTGWGRTKAFQTPSRRVFEDPMNPVSQPIFPDCARAKPIPRGSTFYES